MSGSSLDGLDIVFVHLLENAGKWSYEIKAADCITYDDEWQEKLKSAPSLSAADYCLLHTEYGHYTGRQVNQFIEDNDIHLQMDLIASHGHTVFHQPDRQMTAQIGDGAAIAAETGVAVVSDLRHLDLAFGGQGAPLVPMGEKGLFPDYQLFLNLGGIANLSFHQKETVTAYDVCPANRVLNLLAAKEGQAFDKGGETARSGKISQQLLEELNAQSYYEKSPPKSLANEFGSEILLTVVEKYSLSTADKLCTFVAHIAVQIEKNIAELLIDSHPLTNAYQLLVTGGGAFNTFLIENLKEKLNPYGVEPVVPDADTVVYKEAVIMAFLGALRWRENNTTLTSVTGASRGSIGGALWMGQEGW